MVYKQFVKQIFNGIFSVIQCRKTEKYTKADRKEKTYHQRFGSYEKIAKK